MTPPRPACLTTLVLLATLAAPLRAQVGFEGLFKDITDINFFFTCWGTREGVIRKHDCPVGSNGYGLEVLYEVGRIGLPGSPTRTTDGAWKLTEKTETRRGASVDSTRSYVWEEPSTRPVRYVLLEFAFGYSQFSGFESADTSFDLRGSVRELPAVSMYDSLNVEDAPFPLNYLSPYVGLRSGLLQLNNVQILDHVAPDTSVAYSGSALAFQLGVAGGLVVSFGDRIHLFVERAQHVRRFPNVQWSATGTPRVRRAFPQTLDFSGSATLVGVQLTIRDPN